MRFPASQTSGSLRPKFTLFYFRILWLLQNFCDTISYALGYPENIILCDVFLLFHDKFKTNRSNNNSCECCCDQKKNNYSVSKCAAKLAHRRFVDSFRFKTIFQSKHNTIPYMTNIIKPTRHTTKTQTEAQK